MLGTWLTNPLPEHILNGSMFFDLRTIYGDPSLEKGLREMLAGQPPAVRAYYQGLVLMRAGLLSEAVSVARASADESCILPYGIASTALERLGLGKSKLGTEMRNGIRGFPREVRDAWVNER